MPDALMHDLTADLPPPRDDEPASLRQDIIDELTDHLECATRRELLTNTTASGGRQSPETSAPSDAYTRALTRFGNPATLARRLWLDAMQEKLMAQKITMGALAVITLVAIGMFVLTWRAMDSVQAMVQDNQATNTALLARLEGLTETPVVANYDWCQFKVRLAQDTHDGPPAVGMKVSLQKVVPIYGGGSQSATATNSSISYPFQELTSDEQGIAEFSPVPYGPYHLAVKTPDGHMLKQDIAVRPGHNVEVTIACPVSPSDGKVTLTLNLDDIDASDEVREELWVLCRIYLSNTFVWGSFGTDSQFANGTYLDGDRWIMWETREVLVSQEGTMYEVEWPQLQEERQITGGDGTTYTDWFLDETFSLADDASPIENLTLPVGRFYEVDYELVRRSDTAAVRDGVEWALIDPDFEAIQLAAWQTGKADPPIPTHVIADTTTEWLVNVRGTPTSNGQPNGPNRATDHKLIRPTEPMPVNHPDFKFDHSGFGFGGGGGGGGGFF